jgi:GT2 family glycosyltransferase
MKNESVPSVICIVVNWNGWADTLQCLESLGRTSYGNFSIILVDNGSTNDSVTRIRAAFPDLEIIESAVNLGFGAGNNLGIRRALDRGAKYIWLLNNDTVVLPQTLSALVATAEADPSLGAIGAVLHYADEPERIQAWGGGYVNLWMGTSRHFHGPVSWECLDYLTAASVLIPTDVFREVGLFDEQYFMYWEDTDLSFRIRRAGWKLGVAEGAKLLHKEGSSTGAKGVARDRLVTASGIRFLRSYSGHRILSMAMFIGGRSVKRLACGNLSGFLAILKVYRSG